MNTSKLLCAISLFTALLCQGLSAQPDRGGRSAAELIAEVDDFAAQQRRMLASAGKRYDASARDKIESDKRSLAKKYAAEIASRSALTGSDLYYLGRLYVVAENDEKALDAFMKFVSTSAPETKGDMLQSARSHVVVLASKRKQMAVAEEAFGQWLKGEPAKQQQPILQDYLSTGYFKAGQYDDALRHAQAAFDLLKTLPTKTLAEKRTREHIYMNLVEVLAMAYKKNKNTEQALNVLAEARAQSFTIPSADLYRKVMSFVEGAGFSEKKLMLKVESYATADPAPEMKIVEWIGQDPVALEYYRGRVVLLDFWATWCGPCISTFPRLRGWHKKFSGNDFVLIGVTQYYGEQDGKQMTALQELEYLRGFKEKHKLPYPFAVASGGEAAAKYGINAYPTTVLLDRNGVVRYIGIGASQEESENLEDMIKKVIKEDTRLAATQR